MTLFVDLAYWCVLLSAAFGGVIVFTFLALCISESRKFRRQRARFDRRMAARAVAVDRDDPLELQLALPSAPVPALGADERRADAALYPTRRRDVLAIPTNAPEPSRGRPGRSTQGNVTSNEQR